MLANELVVTLGSILNVRDKMLCEYILPYKSHLQPFIGSTDIDLVLQVEIFM
jgi:hypothetical protein